MQIHRKLLAVILVLITGLVFAPQVYAKHAHNDTDADVKIGVTISDRAVINDYLRENYQPAHCPPGLAKKHNGCLPPGIAKKYQLGHPLSDTVEFQPLPAEIVVQLHPMPGYQYVRVDQDVLLIGEATKKVIDAVTLLSAVQ